MSIERIEEIESIGRAEEKKLKEFDEKKEIFSNLIAQILF